MNFFKICNRFIKMKIKEHDDKVMRLFFCINTIRLPKQDKIKYPLKKLLKKKLVLEDYWEACELIDGLCNRAFANGLQIDFKVFEELSK